MKRRFVHFLFWSFSLFLAFPASLRGAPGDVLWVDDAVPAGAWTAAERGDQWLWVGSNPTPFSGILAHQSALVAGIHNHYFSDAAAKLTVNAQDTLFTYVYLNPANPPREIMLLWFDGGSWMHAAYWGENLIPWGTDGTASQRRIGGLPQTGEWVRLEVPANLVELGGRTVLGMNFVLYDGQATWDYSGKMANAALPTVTVRTLYSDASETDRRYGIFEFERAGGDVNEALTVHFTYEGTATLGTDYESSHPDGYITFPPEGIGVQVYVTPIEDVEVEGTETITLRLLMPDNGTYRTGSSNTATVFLEDNDTSGLPTVEVYADDSTADEEQFESGALPDWGGFRFLRSGGTSAELTVQFTVSGTASNGVDYKRITNAITFAAGAFSAGFTIEPMDDALAEPPETVVVTLTTNAAYTVGSRKSATVTILDDDGGPPRLLIRRESNGVVDIAVQGDVGRTYRLEGSTDLVNWTQVSNDQVMQSYPLVFRDTDAPNYPRRFYRAIQMQ